MAEYNWSGSNTKKPGPKTRRVYHRKYQKRRLADPDKRAAYNAYQREYKRKKREAEQGISTIEGGAV